MKINIRFAALGLLLLLILFSGSLQKLSISLAYREHKTNADSVLLSTIEAKLKKERLAYEKKLDRLNPKTPYMVINSSANEFMLYSGGKLIDKDKCSTGSYILLKTKSDKDYLFKTPKGEFRVQGKIVSPVWRKPDWAFIEEGLPVPPPGHHSRYEAGVLGDYALSLGDGYLIHGTLYQRFLGLPVTHGCVRLDDASLELVYRTLRVGSKVYIF